MIMMIAVTMNDNYNYDGNNHRDCRTDNYNQSDNIDNNNVK